MINVLLIKHDGATSNSDSRHLITAIYLLLNNLLTPGG